MFARLTQSQAISQSFRVFITFRSMRDTTFFHFFETHFLYKIPLLLPWWSKDVLVVQVASGQLRNPPVKFRHERWLHLAIDQHPACPNRGRLELWPRKWFLFGRNPWRWACWSIYSPVDKLSRCRSTQVKLYTGLIASIDLWPQEMFTFSEMLALVPSETVKAVSVPTSVIGGLRGSTATSDLVQEELFFQCHLFELLTERNSFQTVKKLSFLGERTRPIVYSMNFPGSYSREGVIFLMSVPRGGVIQGGRYSSEYGTTCDILTVVHEHIGNSDVRPSNWSSFF